MARNLPVAFAAILAGGVLLDAAIKGAPISAVIKGQASSSGSTGPTATGAVTPAASNAPQGFAGKIAGANGGGLVNPFGAASGLQIGRTDQGVDANLTPGSPILAPFAGTITAINPNWYSGQPQIVLQGAKGTPWAGRFLYLAEQIIPSVKVGQNISAGDQLATYAPSGTGIEMGWASNPAGETLARATSGYSEGQPTPAGQSFRAFLRSLGVNVG